MITIIVLWGILLMNNPYIIAAWLFQVLLLLTLIVIIYRKFIGCILFLVYVGGIMILISYCVILLPINKFPKVQPYAFILLTSACSASLTPVGSYVFGLLYNARVIFLLALILFLVMLAIVSIIDYSNGILKMYVQPKHLFLDQCPIMPIPNDMQHSIIQDKKW